MNLSYVQQVRHYGTFKFSHFGYYLKDDYDELQEATTFKKHTLFQLVAS